VLASLPASEIASIGVDPPPNAKIPVDASWQDERGRDVRLGDALQAGPVVLIFADFTCTSLCSPMLGTVSGLLADSKLVPGRDYRLLVLGLDPKDGTDDALAMRRQIGDSRVLAATAFLRADQQRIGEATRAVGYRFSYDAEHDQFAHPAALLILTVQGGVSRVLSGLGLSSTDLRLALIEAGQGQVGSRGDRLQLMCYAFDPALGIYTPLIQRGLVLASVLTVVLVAILIFALSRPRAA
jgi:protein SCO1/2